VANDTRRRILETALDRFAAQGYEGASTRQIAEGAGVNLPAIQYYFGNKEGLYRAIIDDITALTDRHMAALAERVRTRPRCPRDPARGAGWRSSARCSRPSWSW